jgi:predicted MFS family arabinose efflux permease
LSQVSRRYAWYVLGLLTTINFVNYVDRMVIVSMYDDLRAKFHLSNGQIGALSTAFFVVHALTTFPFGWAADHWNRVRILGLAVIFWSLATLGSAYSIGFFSLMLLRGAIGVGEAAYGPVSSALLAEVFPPQEKARTLGIFNGGMFFGACVGLATGALLGFPLAFQVVALPGIVLGIMALTLRVSPRRTSQAVDRRITLRVVIRDFRRVRRGPTMRWMLASGILISFAAGGSIAWITDLVVKTKGYPVEKATIILGSIVASAGVLGALSGGFVADRLQRRGPWGRTLTIAIGFAAAIPPTFGFIYIDHGWPFLLSAWFQMYFLPWYNGPMAAVIDDIVDDRDANSAQAAFTMLLHLIGTGSGSLVVGWISDYTTLRTAFLAPTAATILASVCALAACRHVGTDMAAKAERARAAAPRERAAVQ